MKTAAARALQLEKSIKQAKLEVEEFEKYRQGCVQSIKYSVTLIQVEWGKMERYETRRNDSQKQLEAFEAELGKVRKNVHKETLQDRRAELLAELRELDSLGGK